ncbi:NADH-quinone oxidoreductase subunit N [Flammeovirga agarivorans]|uniref:NADH-quinone oxidoreductase subunit N n=1 Tax=Flammeovirga agarivorans TaxID=2726742 RepID=A0A7X8SM27_9BACT|nr:NADH-quinone oxidoreductase subunit N [Flammeovirga agarivorans]NLR92729.1 NADH-quinone oxidoreductase subunit N [Flammeovirga agarivorans]
MDLLSKLNNIIESLPYLFSEGWLTLALIVLLTLDLCYSNGNKRMLYVLAIITVIVDIIYLAFFAIPSFDQLMMFTIVNTSWSIKLKILVDFCALLLFYQLWARHPKSQHEKGEGEWIVLALGMLIGGHVLIIANDFVLAILAMELISLPSYLLTAFKNNKIGTEAAIKYFIFGAISTAITIYGASLMYGLTGGVDLQSAATFADQNSVLFMLAVIFIVIGFLFKLGAFPMHVWVPDVYQSAPIEAVAFFSTMPKVASTIFLYRFFYFSEVCNNPYISYFLLLAALFSMFIGNLSALYQKGMRRLMGYSSIAGAGFILIGIVNINDMSSYALYYFLWAYVIGNFAIFYFIGEVEDQTGDDRLESIKGIGWTNASLIWGPAIVVSAISLIGLPPAAGFTGKLLIFSSLWDLYMSNSEIYYAIVMVLGLLNTAISIAYYIKIPFNIYHRKEKVNITFNPYITPLIFILGLSLFILFIIPSIIL